MKYRNAFFEDDAKELLTVEVLQPNGEWWPVGTSANADTPELKALYAQVMADHGSSLKARNELVFNGEFDFVEASPALLQTRAREKKEREVIEARRNEYGDVFDQLDEIYHDIDAWRARIANVKARNPKLPKG